MILNEIGPGGVQQDEQGTWWHRCAKCAEVGPLEEGHVVTIDDHGLVTIEGVDGYGSIICPHCKAHYHLERGEVRDA